MVIFPSQWKEHQMAPMSMPDESIGGPDLYAAGNDDVNERWQMDKRSEEHRMALARVQQDKTKDVLRSLYPRAVSFPHDQRSKSYSREMAGIERVGGTVETRFGAEYIDRRLKERIGEFTARDQAQFGIAGIVSKTLPASDNSTTLRETVQVLVDSIVSGDIGQPVLDMSRRLYVDLYRFGASLNEKQATDLFNVIGKAKNDFLAQAGYR
jgi:hypothetical protein